jgi:hypothetical protein
MQSGGGSLREQSQDCSTIRSWWLPCVRFTGSVFLGGVLLISRGSFFVGDGTRGVPSEATDDLVTPGSAVRGRMMDHKQMEKIVTLFMARRRLWRTGFSIPLHSDLLGMTRCSPFLMEHLNLDL